MGDNWTEEDYEEYQRRRHERKHLQEKTLQKLNLKANVVNKSDLMYKNKRKIVDGIEFRSTKEANRYCELKILRMSHQIKDFEIQPEFELQETIRDSAGKCVCKMIKYIADFKVFYNDGKIVIEDVKSIATAKNKAYKIKKKLFIAKYGKEYEFREIL